MAESGLGGRSETTNVTYLGVAGGYIWDKKATAENPNYMTQEYTFQDEVKERAGAAYESLVGKVTRVLFMEGKFGELLNVSVTNASGDVFVLGIKMGSRNSTPMMKGLLMADLEKDLKVSPYDFISKDTGKRVVGLSFKQDGEKIKLNEFEGDSPTKESEFFKTAGSKKIKRFFEDVEEWFQAEVEMKVIPLMPEVEAPAPKAEAPKAEEAEAPKAEEAEAPKAEEADAEQAPAPKAVSGIAMKRAIKNYIAENYEGRTMPSLAKEQVTVWYNLVLAEDELPFISEAEAPAVANEVSGSDVDAQLAELMG